MKSRLTITLSKDILAKIDGTIDKKKIRNRSHAIEHLVSQSLNPEARTAVILAGAKKGNFLAPIAKVGDRTLLEATIRHLKKNKVKRIVICAGKNENQIKKVLESKKNLGVKIIYIPEEKKLGTAGVLKKARKHLSASSFLVIHGDVLTKIDLLSLMKFHEDEKSVATIAVKPRAAEKKFGKVSIQGNRIVKFWGMEGDRGLSIVNTGIYSFTPQIFDYLPNKTPLMLEKDIFPKLAKTGDLSAFFFQGTWFDIADKKDLKNAVKAWKGRG